MKVKILIFAFIFAYLIIQNLLSVYVSSISFDFKMRRLLLKHYRCVQENFQLKSSHKTSKEEWKREFNYTTLIATTRAKTKSTTPPITLINHVFSKKRKHKYARKQRQPPQPLPPPSLIYGLSYHYKNMKNFTKMTGLHDKLKVKFSQNLNESFPFEYIIKNEALCWPKLYLVNLLLSAPSDFKARSAIREMWGSPLWKKNMEFQVVHFLGKSENETINAEILAENDRYGDIVQVDFKDSYDNLTFKVLSGLHWTNEFCPNVKWVMKSDKDVVVNIFRLIGFLKDYSEKVQHLHSNILCKPKPAYELFPLRNHPKHKKWNVHLNEYPFDSYPPSCYGPAYIIPREMIPKFYAASDKRHPFRMEDVYYTGIIPQVMDDNVNIHNIGPLFPWRPKGWPRKVLKSLLVFEMERYHTKESVPKLWKKMLSQLQVKSTNQSEAKKEGSYKTKT